MLVAAAFFINVYRAIEFDMHVHPGIWVSDSIPAVLSNKFYDINKKYMPLKEITSTFQEEMGRLGSITLGTKATIKKIQDSQINDTKNYELLGSDDKGIVDFISVAFNLFGSSTEALLVFYYFLFGSSCIAFFIAYKKSKAHIFLLTSILIVNYLILPSIKYNPQLTTILALRVFPMLSLVACLHCLCFLLDKNSEQTSKYPSRIEIFLFTAQIILIFVTMHLRTTTLWQIFIIGFSAAYILALRSYKYLIDTSYNKRINFARPVLALALICIGSIGLQGYRAWSFPLEYKRGDQIMTRVFWHNIFSGFAFHPKFGDRYQIRVDDVSVINATRTFLLEKNMTKKLDSLGNLEKHVVKWAAYDKVVQTMVFDRCKAHRMECISTFLYYKPISFIGHASWIFGLQKLPPNLELYVSRQVGFGDVVKQQFIETTKAMDSKHQRVHLLTSTVPVLIILAFIFLILYPLNDLKNLNGSLKAILLLLSGSFITFIIGYPGPHIIVEPVIVLGAVIYFLISILLIYSVNIITVGVRARTHAA